MRFFKNGFCIPLHIDKRMHLTPNGILKAMILEMNVQSFKQLRVLWKGPWGETQGACLSLETFARITETVWFQGVVPNVYTPWEQELQTRNHYFTQGC